MCALRAQATALERHPGFSHEAPEAKEIPLFPTSSGDVPLKEATFAAGGKLGDSDPAPTGHSARRSEAKRLAKLGWSRQDILRLGRWGGKAIDGYIEEAAAETPCGPEPSPTARALAPGLPVEVTPPAPLQAGALASLETQLTSMASHVKGLEVRQEATERREAARDGGACAAWPAAILNFREGGRMAERLHLLRRPVAGQTSDGWENLLRGFSH